MSDTEDSMVEVVKLLGQMRDAMRETASTQAELSGSSVKLKDAVKAMISAQEKAKDGTEASSEALKDAQTAVKRLAKEEHNLANAMKVAKASTNALDEANEELKSTQEDLVNAMQKVRQGNVGANKDFSEAQKRIKKLKEEIEDYKAGLEGSSGGLRKFQKGLSKTSAGMGILKGGITSAIGTIGKLTGALGITGISFKGVIDTGRQYNQSLYELKRGLEVAGSGSKDAAAAIEYVTEKTTLSKVQFVDLANAISSSFVGLKPSMMEMAKTVEVIGYNIGYSFEAQKKGASSLVSVQNKIPSLYKEIIKVSGVLKAAQESGGVSDELAKEAEQLRSNTELRLQAAGASAQERDIALQMITEKLGSTSKLMDMEKAAAQQGKEMENARLELFQSMQPAILAVTKATTKLISNLSNFKGLIIGVGGAFMALAGAIPILQGITVGLQMMKAAQISFNAAAILNPYVAIATAVIGVGVGIAYLIGKQKKSRAEAEKQRKEVELLSLVEKERKGLVGQIGIEYRNQFEQAKKVREEEMGRKLTAKETAGLHGEILTSVKDQNEPASKLAREYEAIAANVGAQLDVINKIKDALNTQISIAEEFGMVNEKALSNMVTYSKIAGSAAKEAVQQQMEAMQEALAKVDIKVDLKGDMNQQLEQLGDAVSKEENLNKMGKDREGILAGMAIAYGAVKTLAQAEKEIVESAFKVDERRMRQQEKSSAAYEDRLNTQRQLMESAQFGLGASVEMMQKQVNLAYKFMQTYEKTDKDMQKRLMTEHGITAAQISRVQNAQDAAEAESEVANMIGLSSDAQMHLNAYAEKHQQISAKSMKQQQKIYDLTKDIREGYLDAIREMSVGAGEFEKIIGTQEMGTTQLMNAVKDTTGEAKLNSMALGGLQKRSLTDSGVGGQVSGGYTTSGLFMNLSKDEINKRGQRLPGWEKSKAQAEAAMRGDATSQGGAPQVGSGVAAGKEPQYIGPERQQKIQKDATLEALNEWSRNGNGRNFLDAINPGVMGGKFSQGTASKMKNGVSIGLQLSANASGGGSPYGGSTPAPGEMPSHFSVGGKVFDKSRGKWTADPDVVRRVKREEELRERIANSQSPASKPSSTPERVPSEYQKRAAEVKEKILGAIAEKEVKIASRIGLGEGKSNEINKQIRTLMGRQGEIDKESSDTWRRKEDSRGGRLLKQAWAGIGTVFSPVTAFAAGAGGYFGSDTGSKQGFADHVSDNFINPAERFAKAGGYKGARGSLNYKQLGLDEERAQIDAKIKKLKEQNEVNDERLRADRKALNVVNKEERYIAEVVTVRKAQEKIAQEMATEYANKKSRAKDVSTLKRLKSVGLGLSEDQISKAKGLGNREETMRHMISSGGRDKYLDPKQKKMLDSMDERANNEAKDAKARGGRYGAGSGYEKEMAERNAQYNARRSSAIEKLKKNKNVDTKSAEVARGHTSAQQAAGMESSASEQARYNEGAALRDDMFGTSSEGGGNGSGSATVVVKFAPGLQGFLDKAIGIMVEVENAS